VRPPSDTSNASSSPIPPFDQLREVRSEDIDALGHVNNVVYLAWVNDIAIAHWASLTDEAARARLIWVALRHEIDYKAEALLGDTVRVRTWTGAARGLRYARHTQIFRNADQTLLAEALTYWCPMDAATRKPARPSAAIAPLFAKN
jgi:acyl-CoA thioester hydrolase